MLFRAEGANSVAWNADCEALLCYSGNGALGVKVLPLREEDDDGDDDDDDADADDIGGGDDDGGGGADGAGGLGGRSGAGRPRKAARPAHDYPPTTTRMQGFVVGFKASGVCAWLQKTPPSPPPNLTSS